MGASLSLCVTVPTSGERSSQFEEEWHWDSCGHCSKEGKKQKRISIGYVSRILLIVTDMFVPDKIKSCI